MIFSEILDHGWPWTWKKGFLVRTTCGWRMVKQYCLVWRKKRYKVMVNFVTIWGCRHGLSWSTKHISVILHSDIKVIFPILFAFFSHSRICLILWSLPMFLLLFNMNEHADWRGNLGLYSILGYCINGDYCKKIYIWVELRQLHVSP